MCRRDQRVTCRWGDPECQSVKQVTESISVDSRHGQNRKLWQWHKAHTIPSCVGRYDKCTTTGYWVIYMYVCSAGLTEDSLPQSRAELYAQDVPLSNSDHDSTSPFHQLGQEANPRGTCWNQIKWSCTCDRLVCGPEHSSDVG